MYRKTLQQICKGRAYSSSSHNTIDTLDKWISSPRKHTYSDSFHCEHLSDLYITLPTRDGTRKPYEPPKLSSPLGYGHHLAFFHSRTPESQLREDGTDADFSPPEPFTRRMWAGGKINWDPENPLIIGEKAVATASIATVDRKGFDNSQKHSMLFVNQRIDITMVGRERPSVSEERTHVYLTDAAGMAGAAREVKDIPISADFSFEYKPSLTTLFRFSALTFNGHHIHLDEKFAKKEGYRERLVHGPLTAMMLLETITLHNPGLRLKSFEYRARNPIIVNRQSTIQGAWQDQNKVRVWCKDDDGVVGMTGVVEIAQV